MKTLAPESHRRGKVLFSVLLIALLASMVVGSLLVLAQQHHYLTARSMMWCSEVPIAEAGIEEAMTHLNSSPRRYATNGWAYTGSGGFSKTGTNTAFNGYYYTTFYTNKPMRVLSLGYARVPRATNYTSRRVLVFIDRRAPVFGIIGVSSVTMSGTSIIDSFDSSDSDYSTGGLYDPAKARDRAGVGTLATNKPSITTGSAQIFGYAATGPGGSVSGNVGDGSFLANGGTGIQDGHVRDDYSATIPPVANPDTLPDWDPRTDYKVLHTIGGVVYEYWFNNHDYVVDSLKLSGTKNDIYITGDVRLWVKGDVNINGAPKILMAAGSTLRLYIGGTLDMSGQCVFNTTGSATNCTIYGLPTCTSLKLAGSADMYMRVYAPQAAVKMSGGFDFSGGLVAKTIDTSGLAGIHYDEALGITNPQEWWITSWEEL